MTPQDILALRRRQAQELDEAERDERFQRIKQRDLARILRHRARKAKGKA